MRIRGNVGHEGRGDRSRGLTGIRWNLIMAFGASILALSLIFGVLLMQFTGFRNDMTRLLEGQTLFGSYNDVLTDARNLLRRNYESTGTSLPLRFRQILSEATEYAEGMERLFPEQAVQDLVSATETLCQMNAQIDSLAGPDEYAAKVALMHGMDLIELQYDGVRRSIQSNTLIRVRLIESANRRSLAVMLGLLSLSVIACMAFSVWYANRLVRPLHQMVAAARDISWNQFDPDSLPNPTQNNEIGYLICAISDMAERTKSQWDLLEEKARLEREISAERISALNAQKMLKESELMILQAEINPHFLFNSMNLLRQMAYLENASKTGEITEVLSDMLRYSLSCMQRSTTLGEELENARNYLYIQEKRFGEGIKTRVEVSPAVDIHYGLPPMVLQPIIENAYKHNVGGSKANGVIQVRVYGEEGRLRLEVGDNGAGIEEERLLQINKALEANEPSADGTHIGLKNVIARLRLFFEGDANLWLESDPGVWTRVVVDLPLTG